MYSTKSNDFNLLILSLILQTDQVVTITLINQEEIETEAITEEEIRMVREAQADRMTSYHFKLWMMERMKKDDGHKGIH